MAGSAAPIPPVAIKISAQNEALKELEKARAEITRLMSTATRGFGTQLPQAARASTEGLQAVRSGMQALAFQATGIEGPIGRVSSGLLNFAGGSTLVLGVTGGLAAIATAYKLSTHEIQQFAEANEQALVEQRQLLVQAHPELGPRVSAENEVRKRQNALDAARARLAELQAPKPGGGAGGRPETLGTEQQITDLNTEIATLTHNLTLAGVALDKVVAGPGRDFITQMEHERDLIGLTARQAAELRAEWAKLSPAEIKLAGDIAAATEKRREDARQTAAAIELLQEFRIMQAHISETLPSVMAEAQGIGIGIPKFTPFEGIERQKEQAGLGFFKEPGASAAHRELERSLQASAKAAREAALAHQQSAITIVGAAASLFTSFATGGAGGIVGGAGAFVSTLGGLKGASGALLFPQLGVPGAVLSGLGGVFSLFDRSEDRRTDRIVQAIDRMAKEVGLERVSVVFTGPDGHEIRRALSELESSDAVQRIPAPAGAAG